MQLKDYVGDDNLSPSHYFQQPLLSDSQNPPVSKLSRWVERLSFKTAAVVLLLFGGLVCERVSFPILFRNMKDYRFMLCQAYTILLVPIMAVLFLFKRATNPGHSYTQVSAVSKWKLFGLSLFSTVEFFLYCIPAAFVPPAMTVVFLQLRLPATTLLFVAFRKDRMHWVSMVGAAALLASCLFAIVVVFVRPSYTEEQAINCILCAASFLPAALLGFARESILRSQPADPHLMTAWISLFQFILGWIVAPVAYYMQTVLVPMESMNQEMALVFKSIKAGFICMFSGEQCSYGLLLFLLFFGGGLASQWAAVQVFQRWSDNAMYGISVVGTIVSYGILLFVHPTSLAATDFVLLGLLSTGIILWRSVAESKTDCVTQMPAEIH